MARWADAKQKTVCFLLALGRVKFRRLRISGEMIASGSN